MKQLSIFVDITSEQQSHNEINTFLDETSTDRLKALWNLLAIREEE